MSATRQERIELLQQHIQFIEDRIQRTTKLREDVAQAVEKQYDNVLNERKRGYDNTLLELRIVQQQLDTNIATIRMEREEY